MNEREAEIVRWMFESYASGVGILKITRTLEERGVLKHHPDRALTHLGREPFGCLVIRHSSNLSRSPGASDKPGAVQLVCRPHIGKANRQVVGYALDHRKGQRHIAHGVLAERQAPPSVLSQHTAAGHQVSQMRIASHCLRAHTPSGGRSLGPK